MQTTKHGKQQLSLLQPSSLSNEWRAGVELGLVLYGLRAGCEWCEEDVCWVGIFWVVVFRHVLALFCGMRWWNAKYVDWFLFSLSKLSAIVTTDALSEGSRRVIVIVVKVIPAKTTFHAVCNNDHGPRRLSTKLAQDLDHGCARRVGYILSGAILYPVTWCRAGQRTDWMSLAMSTCLELPRIASSWLGS